MSDSADNTKDLDSYGVWVKRPPLDVNELPSNDLPDFEDFENKSVNDFDEVPPLEEELHTILPSPEESRGFLDPNDTGEEFEEIEDDEIEDDDIEVVDQEHEVDASDIVTEEEALGFNETENVDDLFNNDLNISEKEEVEDPEVSTDSFMEEPDASTDAEMNSNDGEISLDSFTEEPATSSSADTNFDDGEISLDNFMEEPDTSTGAEMNFDDGEISLDNFLDDASDSSNGDDVSDDEAIDIDLDLTGDDEEFKEDAYTREEEPMPEEPAPQEESLSLEDFGLDSSSQEDGGNGETITPTNQEGTEDVDLSDFGIENDSQETPVTNNVKEAKKAVQQDYNLSLSSEDNISDIQKAIDAQNRQNQMENDSGHSFVDDRMLSKIMEDLSGLKEEFDTLKQEFINLKSSKSIELEESNSSEEIPVQEETAFEEHDDELSLSGDELNNILATSEMKSEEISDTTTEAPIEETPFEEVAIEDAPIEEASMEEVSMEDAPFEEAPIENTPIEEEPIEEALTEDTIFGSVSEIQEETSLKNTSLEIENDLQMDFDNEQLEDVDADKIEDEIKIPEETIIQEFSPVAEDILVDSSNVDFMENLSEAAETSNEESLESTEPLVTESLENESLVNENSVEPIEIQDLELPEASTDTEDSTVDATAIDVDDSTVDVDDPIEDMPSFEDMDSSQNDTYDKLIEEEVFKVPEEALDLTSNIEETNSQTEIKEEDLDFEEDEELKEESFSVPDMEVSVDEAEEVKDDELFNMGTFEDEKDEESTELIESSEAESLEPSFEESLEDVTEPSFEESLEDVTEPSLEESIEDIAEPSLEESLEDIAEPSLEESSPIMDNLPNVEEISLEESIPGMDDLTDITPTEVPSDQIITEENAEETAKDEVFDFPTDTLNEEDFQELSPEPIAEEVPLALDNEDLEKEDLPSLNMYDHTGDTLEGDLSITIKDDVKKVLGYMDRLLVELPDDKIQEFAKSEHFATYKKLLNELGLTQ